MGCLDPTLPWRVATILGISAGGGVLSRLVVPRLGLVLGALAAVAAGWRLRFRPSTAAVAWRQGAAGERRTARLLARLERYGWAVLHDLALPGSQANLDHLVIGLGGVFVIDSKQYRGRLQLDASGRLWHGRYSLAPALGAVSFEADRAARTGRRRGQPRPDPLPWRRLTIGACRGGHPPCCWWRGPCPRKSFPQCSLDNEHPACPGRAGGCGVRSASWP